MNCYKDQRFYFNPDKNVAWQRKQGIVNISGDVLIQGKQVDGKQWKVGT
jgi:hypothetical protein